jgi:hypothetical protein
MKLTHIYDPEGVVAGCGCTIERAGVRVTFTSCAMHDAAQDLLEALQRIHTATDDPVVRAMAAVALAKAEGRHEAPPTDAAPAAGGLVAPAGSSSELGGHRS